MGIQEYIRYHSKNVSLKHYESLADWEELTAKNFIFFCINIAPTLPPDVTPSTVTAQPPLAITDPLSDWKKGVKRDMSIFRDGKISTSLALDSLHKIRVSCVKNHVSARSDAQICFSLLNMMRRVLIGPKT